MHFARNHWTKVLNSLWSQIEKWYFKAPEKDRRSQWEIENQNIF